MTEALTVQPTLAVADLLTQSKLIQQLLKEIMIPGHHYGEIPGTEARPGEKKRPPVLLKPGAEKLCSLFRLSPSFDVRTTELPNGHRDERVICTLTHIGSGAQIATGIGSCSTMETKYRYRNAKPKCPECGVEAIMRSKKADRPGWYCFGKLGGCGCEFGPKHEVLSKAKPGRAENPDIADQYNTVLKMAVKRAHVHATLIATAASDMFVVEEDAETGHDDGGDDDHAESRPEERRGGQQQQADKKPPPSKELSRKDQLIRDCLKLVTTLGMSKEKLATFLDDHGIEAPKDKWSDLNEDALAKIHGLLASEVASREGAPRDN